MRYITILILFLCSLTLNLNSKNIILRVQNNKQNELKQNFKNLSLSPVLETNIISKKYNDIMLGNSQQDYYFRRLQEYFTINNVSDEVLDSLSKLGEIEVFENKIYRIDKLDDLAKSIADKTWSMEQINVVKAWQKATGKDIIVGLIDTGIEFDHPDLKNSLWINKKEDLNQNGTFEPWNYTETINGLTGDLNGIDDDGNGYIDDVIGYDFVDQDKISYGDYTEPDPIPEDEGNHGTSVGGLIAARPINDSSVVGVAYNAKILVSKAFDISGNAESDDIAKAIVYAVMNGAKVINMSFGEDYSSPILYDAIKFAYYSGCILVASSGNNGWNRRHYPSDYPEVICVGSSNSSGKRSGSSNYGTSLDVLAPGQEVKVAALRGLYKISNGTSLASPHVSGLAALLLELDSTLNNDDVKTILQMSSTEVNEYDNTYMTGTGIVNAKKSIDNLYKGKVKFNYPDYNNVISFKDEYLKLNATITHPLFDKAEIMFSPSQDTIVWQTLEIIDKQIINTELQSVKTDIFRTGINLLAIRLHLKNNKYFDEIIPIQYFNKNENYIFNYVKTIQAYKNQKRLLVIGARTNRLSELIVEYHKFEDTKDNFIIRDYIQYSTDHLITIENLEPNVEYYFKLIAILGKDTLIETFTSKIDGNYFTTENFILKPYQSNRAYINNNWTNKLYNNDQVTFAINDMKDLQIGNTYTIQLQNNKLVNIDTSTKGYIPLGYGDSNGDGIEEILTTAEMNTILYQSNEKGGNPFDKILFESNSTVLWGEQFYDIDNDGLKEFIGYNNHIEKDEYYLFKYINGKYDTIASIKNPVANRKIGLERGSAIGDFDGDGKNEFYFSNSKGMIFIYEYDNSNGFSLEFMDTTRVSFQNQDITRVDVDGDGIYEILHANYGNSIVFGKESNLESIWMYRLLKSDAPNSYKVVWQDYVFPVKDGNTRQNLFYRNGIAAGNLDNEVGDEIILTPFPNLYVLKWNKENRTFDNFWYYPSALSNSCLVVDLDKNGVNELGFTSFNSLRFFEYQKNTNYKSITNLDGWAIDNKTAFLKWDKNPAATKYEIFKLVYINNSIQAEKITETDTSTIVLDNLESNKMYEFVVRFVDSEKQYSDFSDVAEIYTLDRIRPIRTKIFKNDIIELQFSGKVATNSINPGYFVLSRGNEKIVPSSAIVVSDNLILLRFKNELAASKYNFEVASFRDYYKNWSIDTTFEIEIFQNVAEDELYMTKLEFLSESLIKLWFNKDVDSSALDVKNYVIKPYGEVIFAEKDVYNNNAVMMNISSFFRNSGARGLNYTLSGYNIFAEDKTPITKGAGNTLGFVINSPTLEYAYIYPNPIKYSENPEIMIANLTLNATVTIKTLDGKEIIRLFETDGNGGVEWDGLDKNGNRLKSGVYLFDVEGRTSQNRIRPETHKFVIINE